MHIFLNSTLLSVAKRPTLHQRQKPLKRIQLFYISQRVPNLEGKVDVPTIRSSNFHFFRYPGLFYEYLHSIVPEDLLTTI